MLKNEEIIGLARKFLINNDYPIEGEGKIKFPKDRHDLEAVKHFQENHLASVSFPSIYLNKPEHPQHELDSGIYIVYVNYISGEVYMPPHM